MSKALPALFLCSVLSLVLGSSGCAINDLKNTNRRLKEANDRLVAENNRLEQELAATEKELSEKTRLLDDLRKPSEGEPRVAADDGSAKVRLRPGGFDDPGIDASYVPHGILLRLDDRVFFGQGRATLSQKGREILTRVSRRLNSQYRENLIRVEGHTDDVPVRKVKNQYPSNWELSTARACTVVRYLVDNASLSPRRIYPAGFADHKPVTAARNDAARQRNRRVEILILNEKA